MKADVEKKQSIIYYITALRILQLEFSGICSQHSFFTFLYFLLFTFLFSNRLLAVVLIHLRGIMDYFYQLHKTDFNLPVHKKERQSRLVRKDMLVSHICRNPAAVCLDFLVFSVFCCSRCFTNPKCWYLTS